MGYLDMVDMYCMIAWLWIGVWDGLYIMDVYIYICSELYSIRSIDQLIHMFNF